jgi:hypothetical protein
VIPAVIFHPIVGFCDGVLALILLALFPLNMTLFRLFFIPKIGLFKPSNITPSKISVHIGVIL